MILFECVCQHFPPNFLAPVWKDVSIVPETSLNMFTVQLLVHLSGLAAISAETESILVVCFSPSLESPQSVLGGVRNIKPMLTSTVCLVNHPVEMHSSKKNMLRDQMDLEGTYLVVQFILGLTRNHASNKVHMRDRSAYSTQMPSTHWN